MPPSVGSGGDTTQHALSSLTRDIEPILAIGKDEGPARAGPSAIPSNTVLLGNKGYQVAITLQGPPEPSSHGIRPTYAVAPLGGILSRLFRFSSP